MAAALARSPHDPRRSRQAGLRIHRRQAVRPEPADRRVHPRRRARPQRVGTANALLRAPRLQRAGRRLAGPRPQRRSRAAPASPRMADWLAALLDAAGVGARLRDRPQHGLARSRSISPRAIRRASTQLALARHRRADDRLRHAARRRAAIASPKRSTMVNQWSHSTIAAKPSCPGPASGCTA